MYIYTCNCHDQVQNWYLRRAVERIKYILTLQSQSSDIQVISTSLSLYAYLHFSSYIYIYKSICAAYSDVHLLLHEECKGYPKAGQIVLRM